MGPDGRPPGQTFRQRLIRLCADLQDRLWSDHEKWTSEHGFESWRSPSGWKAYGRDARFDLRRECSACDGTGRHRVAVGECEECSGTGVVTLPGDDDWAELDDSDEGSEGR